MGSLGNFLTALFATSKVGIFNWLSSLGLDVLELPYEEMRKCPKRCVWIS